MLSKSSIELNKSQTDRVNNLKKLEDFLARRETGRKEDEPTVKEMEEIWKNNALFQDWACGFSITGSQKQTHIQEPWEIFDSFTAMINDDENTISTTIWQTMLLKNSMLQRWFRGEAVNFGSDEEPNIQVIPLNMLVKGVSSLLCSKQTKLAQYIWDSNKLFRDWYRGEPYQDSTGSYKADSNKLRYLFVSALQSRDPDLVYAMWKNKSLQYALLELDLSERKALVDEANEICNDKFNFTNEFITQTFPALFASQSVPLINQSLDASSEHSIDSDTDASSITGGPASIDNSPYSSPTPKNNSITFSTNLNIGSTDVEDGCSTCSSTDSESESSLPSSFWLPASLRYDCLSNNQQSHLDAQTPEATKTVNGDANSKSKNIIIRSQSSSPRFFAKAQDLYQKPDCKSSEFLLETSRGLKI